MLELSAGGRACRRRSASKQDLFSPVRGLRDNPAVPSIRDTLIFFTVGSVILGFGLWMIRWRLRARSWQMVAGRLLSKDIVSDEAGGDTSYKAVARYQYVGAGRELTGDRLRFDGQGGSKRVDAKRLYDALPETGHAVNVWFDPTQPDQSVLDPRLRLSTYGVALFGAIFVLGSLAPWIIRAVR